MQLTKPTMYFRSSFLILFLLMISCYASARINHRTHFGWILPYKYDPLDTISSDQIKNGSYYLLVDRQMNTTTNQFYSHYAYRVVSELGVQNNSEIQIEYKPAYQKFFLHSIKIIRNGVITDAAATSQIKEIQQETDLNVHIYDESKTVYIILKDVRPNDIIEYDYTIEGSNPIFNNKKYFIFSPNLDYTLLHFNYRIIKGKDSLHCKYFNESPSPRIIKSASHEEWIWESKNNQLVENEDYTPEWFIKGPYVEVSGYSSWNEVEAWGLDVFSNEEKLNGDLVKEIENIKAHYSSTGKRVMAAVRFVQKQIRYFGIEIGINSHKPASPNKVYKQRFGDCKDKSLLLCKMLQVLDIDAYPVLINTWISDEIVNRLPSAMIFNHAVVKAIVNGREYWFDPTLSSQEGNLENCEFPDYKYALVLDGKLKGLDEVPLITNSKTEIKEDVYISDFEGNALLQIITTYRGRDADNIRFSFKGSNLKEIQKNYLTYYKKSYDSITVSKNLYFSDDTLKNVFITYESYTVSSFWKKEKEKISFSMYSYQINEKLNAYETINGIRNSPLYLEYPLNIYHSINIQFPETWNLQPYNEFINNDFFQFHSLASVNGNRCNIVYELVSLRNYVPANKVITFLKDVKKISENYNGLEFSYTPTSGEKGQIGTGLLIFFLLSVAGMVVLSVWLYKSNTPVASPEIYHLSIGGWMVLPIIGFCSLPIVSLISLFNGNLLNSGDFHSYTSATSSAYNFLWGPYWIISLAVIAAYMVIPVLILVLIFKYDQRAPIYVKYFYAGNIIFSLIILMIGLGISTIDPELKIELWKDLFRAILTGAIWIPYFNLSTRVKNTFVK